MAAAADGVANASITHIADHHNQRCLIIDISCCLPLDYEPNVGRTTFCRPAVIERQIRPLGDRPLAGRDTRASMPMINFEALDVSGVPSIPWENRGTWGEASQLPSASAKP